MVDYNLPMSLIGSSTIGVGDIITEGGEDASEKSRIRVVINLVIPITNITLIPP